MSDQTVLEAMLSLPSLRCDICKGYLSCGPVRLMPNGNCIGGCCPAPGGNIQVYRVRPLEAMLSQISFPCTFSDSGCTVLLPFGQTTQHEDKCIFQSQVCPVNVGACLWKGPAMAMYKHLEEDHPGYIQRDAEFKVNVVENTTGIFMVAKDSIGIIVKYSYTANDNNFNRISLFTSLASSVTVVVELEHQHCNIKSKMFNCRLEAPLTITFNDLPPCFRIDKKLTLNVVDILF